MAGFNDQHQQYRPAARYEAAPQNDRDPTNTQILYQTYEESERYQHSSHARSGTQENVTSKEHYAVPLTPWQRFARNFVSWTCLIITIALFVLTILYASWPKFASSLRMIRSSSSRTIFVLRLLSQLTEFSLAVCLSTAFEKIQWHLTWPGGKGAPFATVCALVPGTGLWGLLQIVFSNLGTHLSARCWSMLRLLSLALVFALGVIIMSDVRTEVGYQLVAVSSEPRSTGYQRFNASAASMFAFTGDAIWGVNMDEFLLNPRIVIDITPADRGSQSCSLGYDARLAQVCARTVFIPIVSGAALDQTYPEADLVVLRNSIGYQLEFSSLDEGFQFEKASDCRTFGSESAAFEMCLRSENDSSIAARINYCVVGDVQTRSCLSFTDWTESPGWSTLMEATLRTADIAYSRRNDTIVTHSLVSDKTPAAVRAEDLLEAYNLFVNAENPGNSSAADNSFANIIKSVLAGGDIAELSNALTALIKINKLSMTIPLVFHTLTLTFPSTPQRAFKGNGILQNLLAIPLSFCSSDVAGRIELSEFEEGVRLQPFMDRIRRGPEVFLAASEHNLIVGQWSVMVYLGFGGLAIVFCSVVLVFATFHPRAASLPNYTPFPIFNFWKWNAVRGQAFSRTSEFWSKEQRVYCTSAAV